MIFGDAPSPFHVCHVIKRALEDHIDSNTNVINLLSRNMYNLLHSSESTAEAKYIAKGTCEKLEKMDFEYAGGPAMTKKSLDR